MSFPEGSFKGNDFYSRLAVHDDGSDFIDIWATEELLFLASCVLRSDRNWVSVSRTVKPFGDQTRPAEWYTPKSCSLQYTELLSEIEEDSKRKTVPRTERETSEAMLVRNLTDRRFNELAWLNQQAKASANILKNHLEMVENGELDDHLDNIIKEIDEQEKRDAENYQEYVIQRASLISTKKLNTSNRAMKSKPVTKTIDPKKKASASSDLSNVSSHHVILDTVKSSKSEGHTHDKFVTSSKPVLVKSEMDSPTLNALLDNKVTLPTSVAPTSPLLTSLLRNITSSASSPTSTQPHSTVKESDAQEMSDALRDFEAVKLREVSPRSRPTPASSPLLNSLLKNTPSTPITPQGKEVRQWNEINTCTDMSPPPFFSPTSSQQLSLSSSSLPQFLQQQESPEGRKSLSPATSACLAAPTLSKLLEMPPSTPGRLPPLPVLEASTTALLESLESMPKTARKLQLDSPTKKTDDSKAIIPDFTTKLLLKIPEKKGLAEVFQAKPLMNTFRENMTLKEVSDSLQQAFMDADVGKEDTAECSSRDSSFQTPSKQTSPSNVKQDKLSPDLKSSMSEDDLAYFLKQHMSDEYLASLTEPQEIQSELMSEDTFEEEKLVSSHKFYKSRTTVKKGENELPDNLPDSSSLLLLSPKRPMQTKCETVSPVLIMEGMTPIKDDLDVFLEYQIQDSKISKVGLSPPSKKPRLFEKAELSEDETLLATRRSGRKGEVYGGLDIAKKGRGRPPKVSKPEEESRDQYEFSDTTDDNLMGSTFSSALCYMPRGKDDDTKDSDDSIPIPTASSPEKKVAVQHKKQGKTTGQHISPGRKALFSSDEERMSDWLASDDASSHVLSEDKLKKWEETCEKKAEQSKVAASEGGKVLPRSLKDGDSPNKKLPPLKRLSISKSTPLRKERKLSGMDSEELSRDSEDTPTEASEEKQSTAMDIEIETSSSVAAESDAEKTTDGAQTPLSPHPPPQHTGGKQEWFQGGSPKSVSEHVSQSSEESEEYESDNWDNHSVSTNKSATLHSPHPRMTRKERESPQYKAWKKAISIVLREASCHKYANVFLQKVTNDVAPGYSQVVTRPMDLSLIKRNIDSGVVRTTEEFHRDMLLMFQNAIMYNSSDHDVYQMALSMQKDVMEQIKAFLITQSTDVDEGGEPTSSLRGARKSVKGKTSAASTPKAKDEPMCE